MIRRMGTNEELPPIVVTEEKDPAELAQARAQDERFRKNMHWYSSHALEIGAKCRGRHICIGGEELFVADTAQEALAQAKAAHPEDNGRFLKYVSGERGWRIYANCRRMDRVR